MAPTTRQARRSPANDATQSDELADAEYTATRMPSKASSKLPATPTLPKRRGRPPGSKNRPKFITTAHQRKGPGTRRLGRPPEPGLGSIEPPDMTPKQIAQALNMTDNEPTTDDRVAAAAKRVYRYTRQWPWQWAVRFLPRRKWSVPMVEVLAQLLRGIHNKSLDSNTSHGNFERTRRFLHDCARHRDRNHPHMIRSDLDEALRHFGVETRKELPPTQWRCQATRTRRLTDFGGSDTESEPDEIAGRDKNLDGSPVAVEDELESFDEREQQNERLPSTSPHAAPSRARKRTLSPNENSRIEKRRRLTDSEADEITQMSTTPTTMFSSMIKVIDHLLAETQENKKILACKLSELRRSIREKKDAIARAATTTVPAEDVNNLREALQRHKEGRQKTENAKLTFEQSLESLCMKQNIIAQNFQFYNTELQEWDETIARTNAEIQRAEEEAFRSSREGIELLESQLKEDRDGARQLEGSLAKVDERLSGCRFIKSLIELGSSGISTLITTLETNNVSLFDIIQDIKTGILN